MLRKRVPPVLHRFARAIALVTALMALAGNAGATKYAGAFMENGGGARALGMGGAFTAVADDPSTTFWNPAGLASAEKREILLMHSERFGDLIDRDFAVYSQPVNWALFGGEASGTTTSRASSTPMGTGRFPTMSSGDCSTSRTRSSTKATRSLP